MQTRSAASGGRKGVLWGVAASLLVAFAALSTTELNSARAEDSVADELRQIESEYWRAMLADPPPSLEIQRQWRDRLAAAVEKAPPPGPIILLGELLERSMLLNDRPNVERYSRLLLDHPDDYGVVKSKAYMNLIHAAASGEDGLARQLELFDRYAEMLRGTQDAPEVKDFELARLPLVKADTIMSPNYFEAPSDRIRAAIRAYQEYLDLPAESQARLGASGNPCYSLRTQAQLYARIGDFAAAVRNYEAILDAPGNPWPKSQATYFWSLAKCNVNELKHAGPPPGPQARAWRELLSDAIDRLPADSWTQTVRSIVAHNYFKCGVWDKYLEWAVPALESHDPDVTAYFDQKPHYRPHVLQRVVESYVRKDDIEAAAGYYRILARDYAGPQWRAYVTHAAYLLPRSYWVEDHDAPSNGQPAAAKGGR